MSLALATASIISIDLAQQSYLLYRQMKGSHQDKVMCENPSITIFKWRDKLSRGKNQDPPKQSRVLPYSEKQERLVKL